MHEGAIDGHGLFVVLLNVLEASVVHVRRGVGHACMRACMQTHVTCMKRRHMHRMGADEPLAQWTRGGARVTRRTARRGLWRGFTLQAIPKDTMK